MRQTLQTLRFLARLISTLGDRSVGALIHTAGLSPTMADAARIFEVNYGATKRLVDAVRPKLAEGGCAVLISSSSAYMVKSAEIDEAIGRLLAGDSAAVQNMIKTPQQAYPISKRAVIALVAREAAAFGKRRTRIVSIAPGLIDTGMGRAEMLASEQTKVMLERTPLGRLGLGDEIASVAVFLVPRTPHISLAVTSRWTVAPWRHWGFERSERRQPRQRRSNEGVSFTRFRTLPDL